MWMRMRFDIAWRDILFAVTHCTAASNYEQAAQETLTAWNGGEQWMAAFSVRSAFDLALRALQLPAGSEVLMSPITVRDMARIVTAHQLVPVPIDLTPDGQLCPESIEANLSPRSRILLAAHLFGGRLELRSIANRVQNAGILLFEDCAQSFSALADPGLPVSDLVMLSFGPIKTATALGGALVRVRDRHLRERMRKILLSDPIQQPKRWKKRVLKFALLKLWSGKRTAAAMHCGLRLYGGDCDRMINSLGKGFSAHDIVPQIRFRPHPGLLRLLTRRLQTYDFRRIERRKLMGRRMDQWLHQSHDAEHAYWTYPLSVADPAALACRLRERGFDATSQSRLVVLPSASQDQPPRIAQQMFQSWCFLPWYPELTDTAASQMAELCGP